MIKKIRQEIWRLKIPIILVLQWLYNWGLADSLKTLSLLAGFIGFSMIIGHLVSKELFGKYKFDIGERIKNVWDIPYNSRANLVIGMLMARVLVYVAIVIAMALILNLLRGGF